jgi:peptidyl-tRNA hydrolase
VRLENWEASGTMKVVVKAETEKELFAIKKQL